MDAAIKNMLTEGGIDVGSMLERCMGNEALLERLLKSFGRHILCQTCWGV